MSRTVMPPESRTQPAQATGQRHGRGAARALQPHTPSAQRLAQRAFAGPGQALPVALQHEAAHQFGRDFSAVRVHDGLAATTAARALDAGAFTLGAQIAMPRLQGRGSAWPRALLMHELAHVAQQLSPLPGARRPAGDALAEREAQAAAAASRSPAAAASPAPAVTPTAAGIACSPEDWLISTPDLRSFGYSMLLSEADEITEWLGRQTSTSPESEQLREALQLLQTEMARREQTAVASGTTGRGKGRKAKSGKGKSKGRGGRQRPAASSTPEAPLSDDAPRILRERSSVAYDSEDDARAEADRIVAWLQRDDLVADDRELLQTELQHLAPQFQQARQRDAQNRRTATVGQALAPSADLTDDAERMLDMLARIDGITALPAVAPAAQAGPAQPPLHALMRGDEQILLTQAEVDRLRGEVASNIAAAARQGRSMNESTMDRLNDHMALNYEDQPIVGFVVSVVSGEDPVDLMDRVQPLVSNANQTLGKLLRQAQRPGPLVPRARRLMQGLDEAARARQTLDQGIGRAMNAAGDVVGALTVVRDLSFAVSLALMSVVVAPVVAAGVGTGGLGLTGAGALVTTGAGTGTVVGAGGFALRGGSAAGGELLSGGSTDQALSALKTEGWRGAKEGFTTGVAGGTAFGSARQLGLGVRELNRAQTIVRSGVAGSAGGGSAALTEGLLEGRSASDTAWRTVKGVGLGGLGGVLGGSTSSISNPLLRQGVAIGGDAALSGGVAYAETGDTTAALMASAQSVAVSGGHASARQSTSTQAKTPRSASTAPVAGPEVFDALAAELGPSTPARSTLPGSAGAAEDAMAAGLIGPRGAPGTVDAAFQPHSDASAVRRVYGVTGRDQQSAHVNATSFLSNQPGYSRGRAPTLLMEPDTHRAFDNHWKAWAKAQRRAGATDCSLAEMRTAMHQAIDQIPGVPAGARGALAQQLDLEIQSLGLSDGDRVRLPYPNVKAQP